VAEVAEGEALAESPPAAAPELSGVPVQALSKARPSTNAIVDRAVRIGDHLFTRGRSRFGVAGTRWWAGAGHP
jgi:hypothetical protein